MTGTENTHLMRAWSCTVRLVVDHGPALRSAAADLATLLARVDAVASRFRPDSALSLANDRAGRPTPIPRLLVELIDAALDAAAQTGGAVDPTVGLAMHGLGYDRDITDVIMDGPPLAGPAASRSWRDVRLDREAGLVTVPAGAALDLGATAKAYIADHAARALNRRYDTGVLVELGGDVAVAGHRTGGWCLEVAERQGGDGQLVLLRHGGLATSTTTVRTWRRGGRAVHHIVDPRTGRPTDGPWRTASVYAPSALAANTASTAAIVMGEGALGWLANRRLAGRLVGRDGRVVTTGTWPATRSAVAAVAR
ncbi:MAG: FAD:protein FMN transferase [Actinomycetota bacterium]|nr:FAD:protein FMN transferase [Actinomycetota bacterium]